METNKSINEKAEELAATLHEVLGEDKMSKLSLMKLIEDEFEVRINVRLVEFKNKGQRGMMSYNHLTKRCTVFVNTEDYKYTQDFTIFHELAHLIRCLVNPAKNVYGFSVGEMYSKPGEERFCDRFAAAALMPARIFSQVWSANGEDADLKKARMTKLFGASGPAVMNRVTDLGLK